MNRDNLHSSQSVLAGTMTLSGTTANSSDWVDTRGFDAARLAVITGAVTDAGTAAGFSFAMQESDTTANADATTVAADDILGSLADLTVTADGDDNKLIGAVGYVGGSRYVRLTATGTSGTDAVVNVFGTLDYPSRAATTFVGTGVAAT
jgi:Rieske Fe-S protein